jgi:D-beta-D-heptose 7-phosphate kinase/D-beta-D-heptose 1-phosphate adenosyltransferase
LGGAGNVVNNIAALGAKVTAAGVIGDDANGRRLLDKCQAMGVRTAGLLIEADRPTTLKTRIIAANQHVLRIDRETKRTLADTVYGQLLQRLETLIPQVNVVLISDYNKGVVTRKLVEQIVSLGHKFGVRIIADPKGLDFSKYDGVSLLTPNQKEAGLAAQVEIENRSSLFAAGAKLLSETELEALLITCGKDGMVLFEPGSQPQLISARTRQVFDVSGAGDTVLAVLGIALGMGHPLLESARMANSAAGVVVAKVGTATVTRAELTAALDDKCDISTSKQRNLEDLPFLIQELRRGGERIVLTNGCFDLLHTGHIRLFQASKQLGDVLIVAIDDDESVTALKGAGRPVLKAHERLRILSALDSIDYVVVFASDQLNQLIETVKPDVLAKGDNYSPEEVAGHKLVEKQGGQVALIPVTEDVSASQIIDAIKQSPKPKT